MKTKCVMGLALLLLSHTVSASDFGIGDLAYHSLPLTGDAVYLDLVGTDQIVFPLHADSDLQGLYSQTVNPQGQRGGTPPLVPIPAAIWLFAGALLTLRRLRRE